MSRPTPLQRVGAIKLKLGAMVVGGVLLSVLVLLGGQAAGTPTWLNVLVALAVALIGVELLGSGLTAPLRQMARQADRLAGGEPVEPVDEDARDEVGALARAFNRMAREVAHTDRVRRDLVANVSHELRTPLAALTAVLENLVDGVEEAGPDALGRMQDQVERLTRLVAQLLDLSQLDAGAVTLERSPVDVAALLHECVAGFRHVGAERVAIHAPDGLVVPLDRDRFAQVVVNLLGNALRHGPDGTPVTLSVTSADGRLRLLVEDKGPGIAVEDAARVFERFARADDGRASTIGGTGLGLAITRWVVELHDGEVHVDRPGEPGARLLVDVPVRTPVELPMDTPMAPAAAPRIAPAGPPVLPPPAPRIAARERDGADVLQVLPTPVAGLSRRGLTAALVAAALVALLLPLSGDTPLALGTALAMLAVGGAVLVATERSLDAYGWACAAIALGVAAQWALTDAAWALVPVTLGAVLLAGLGLWAPRSFGEHLRALVVGPLLAFATPVAFARAGAGEERSETRARLGVPVVATVVVLAVFGSLLAGVDGVFARLLDAVLPDIRIDGTLVGRVLLGLLGGVVVATYLLVQRAGTVPSTPWRRPVRPQLDWALPLGALDLLFAAFVAVQVGVLFGGDGLVQSTTGLTYAEYARSGFGQLLLVTLLTLGVIGAVVRVADVAHRRTRDLLLGLLVGLTAVMLLSAVQRLWLYAEAFGFTRLRLSAFAVLSWVAVMLVAVAAAGTLARFTPHLPRAVVVVTGVMALAFVAMRPDVVIAEQNLARYERTGAIDLDYLTWLSQDAWPTLLGDPATAVVFTPVEEPGPYDTWTPACTGGQPSPDAPLLEDNLARSRARAALEAAGVSCD